jgi:hypothetical protein
VNASKSKVKTNVESSQIKDCECVQGQSESKVGIITYASKSKVEAKLESSKMRPKTKRKQIWNHPRLKTMNAYKNKVKANLESSQIKN